MNGLILLDPAKFAVTFHERAEAQRDEALATSALIARVDNAEQNEIAAGAQKKLREIIKAVEAARKSAKAPIIEYGRAIDHAAEQFVAELKEEEIRIATLAGNFQELENAKLRAAEAARQAEISKLERERQEKLAKAASVDEQDKINAEFSAANAAVPVVEPVRAKGQIVREDWDIIVTDKWSLARAHPMCVEITPRLSEIRALLDAGIKVSGVDAKRVTKASVRTSTSKAITIQ